MQVLITGRHVEITPALRRHIEDRMTRLERYGAKLGDIQVILGVEKYRHTAEGILTLNGVSVQARVSTKEMYASIDELLDKISRQVSKRKEKLSNRKAARAKGLLPPGEEPEPSPRALDVKTVRAPLYRLAVLEAVERLGNQAGALLVFQNEASERVQVLRRLANGSAELIDPHPAP